MPTDPAHEYPVQDPQPDEATASGWDPDRVWRDRVQAPRLARELESPPGLAEPTEPVAAPEPATARASAGWDPLETWRFRVLRVAPSGKA